MCESMPVYTLNTTEIRMQQTLKSSCPFGSSIQSISASGVVTCHTDSYSNGNVSSVGVSGDGFFEDSTAEARMNTVAMAADNVANFKIVVPDFGTYAGAFRIASLEFGGETEGGID